jgi:hypothetical protein
MTTTPPEETAPTDCTAEPDLEDLPLAMTHAAMNAAYDNGDAVSLGTAVAWLVRYQEAWWVVYERGWLRITDSATAQDLDRAADRLAEAEAIVTSEQASRSVKGMWKQ